MDKHIRSLLDELKRAGCLTGPILKELSNNFGDKFWRALQSSVNGQVKKYVFNPSGRVEWIIVGKKRDYLIISDFYCGCDDFYINVVVRKKDIMCYHILSKILSEALGLYEEINVEDSKYDIFMSEWKMIDE
ncbi:MAG: hypothetical protein ACTSYQ_04855 [Candidatus Odinarchaeia archaeon]